MIHTLRDKADLDDHSEYNNLFSAKLHKLWRDKNYWQDKYVNIIYISIVHSAAKLTVNNFSSFMASLSFKRLTSFHGSYVDSSHSMLNEVVNNVMADLAEFKPHKLKIDHRKDGSYSEHMEFFRIYCNSYMQIKNLQSIIYKKNLQ